MIATNRARARNYFRFNCDSKTINQQNLIGENGASKSEIYSIIYLAGKMYHPKWNFWMKIYLNSMFNKTSLYNQ